MFSPIVWPVTVSASRCSRPLAELAASPPAGRRRSRSPPSGTCPTASGSTQAVARRGRAGPSRRASSSTPMRPAMRQQVDHRVGRAADRRVDAGSRSRTPARVRIFDSCRSSLHHLDDAPAGHAAPARCGARRPPGSRRCSGSAMPSASTIDGHGRGGAHGHAVAVRSGACTLSASRNSSWLDLAGAQIFREAPHVGARADVAGRGTCRSASGRRRRTIVGQVDAGRAHQQRRAWSCRSRTAAPRRRADWRGSTPRRPWPAGCGTAWRWAAAASRPAT